MRTMRTVFFAGRPRAVDPDDLDGVFEKAGRMIDRSYSHSQPKDPQTKYRSPRRPSMGALLMSQYRLTLMATALPPPSKCRRPGRPFGYLSTTVRRSVSLGASSSTAACCAARRSARAQLSSMHCTRSQRLSAIGVKQANATPPAISIRPAPTTREAFSGLRSNRIANQRHAIPTAVKRMTQRTVAHEGGANSSSHAARLIKAP